MSKADDLRDANYWHERAEEARVMADHQDDVVAKSQMIDMANKYDMMGKHAVSTRKVSRWSAGRFEI